MSSFVLTISALNTLARSVIESALPLMWVGGEISNLTRAASGHWYFSLKDQTAQVRCAMFRGRNQFVDFQPANGDQVEVRALPTLYEARGEFQLQVEVMRRAGLGALFETFEKLKQKLAAEGLFDEARKRPLPLFPRTLGIVTSSEAAALRDVLTTLRRRASWLPIILYPTPVQGEGAGKKIAEVLRLAAKRHECDVLIMCRGGGSIEDLWAFNEEAVARAIAACPIPVVCGVGHETDFTIADFVADLRAPTPTAAAEQIVAGREEWMHRLSVQHHRMARPLHRLFHARAQQLDFLSRRLIHPVQRLQQQRDNLRQLGARLRQSTLRSQQLRQLRADSVFSRLAAAKPSLEQKQTQLNNLQRNLGRDMEAKLQNGYKAIARLASHLDHLNPDAVLARGYSIVSDSSGKLVRSSKQIKLDEVLDLRFQHGSASARVIHKNDET